MARLTQVVFTPILLLFVAWAIYRAYRYFSKLR